VLLTRFEKADKLCDSERLASKQFSSRNKTKNRAKILLVLAGKLHCYGGYCYVDYDRYQSPRINVDSAHELVSEGYAVLHADELHPTPLCRDLVKEWFDSDRDSAIQCLHLSPEKLKKYLNIEVDDG